MVLSGLKCFSIYKKLKIDFIKSCNDKNDEGYFVQVDVQHSDQLYQLHNDLPLLPERIKIEKVGKLVVKLHDKE